MEGENEAGGRTFSNSPSSVSSPPDSSYVPSPADSFSMNLDHPAATDPSRDYPGFPLFLRLPVELQISIWRLFCPAMGEQRLLRFYDGEDATDVLDEGFNIGWLSRQTASSRVMMSTSRDSRAIGDVFFPDKLEFSSTRKLLRFNRSRDVFYFNLSANQFWEIQGGDVKESCIGIQRIALNAAHIHPVAFWQSRATAPLTQLPDGVFALLWTLADLPDVNTVYWVSYDRTFQFSDLDGCDCSGPGCLYVGSSAETNIIRSVCPPGNPDFYHRATAYAQCLLRTIHGMALQGPLPLPLTRKQHDRIDKLCGMRMASLMSVPTKAEKVVNRSPSLFVCQPIWEGEQLRDFIGAAAVWDPTLMGGLDSEDSEDQEDQDQSQEEESQEG